MSDTIKQNYELAFHISSNLEEADVQKTKQELEKSVTSRGGVISFSKDPEKVRLAYPIKHQQNAYFSYFSFSSEMPESLVEIRDELRLNPNVLRFLLLKIIPESKKAKEGLIRRMASAERRRARAVRPADKPLTSKDGVPKVEDKELEEKLEEIIGKL